jgi:hypothetical protein
MLGSPYLYMLFMLGSRVATAPRARSDCRGFKQYTDDLAHRRQRLMHAVHTEVSQADWPGTAKGWAALLGDYGYGTTGAEWVGAQSGIAVSAFVDMRGASFDCGSRDVSVSIIRQRGSWLTHAWLLGSGASLDYQVSLVFTRPCR